MRGEKSHRKEMGKGIINKLGLIRSQIKDQRWLVKVKGNKEITASRLHGASWFVKCLSTR